jgi:hypothetical protein
MNHNLVIHVIDIYKNWLLDQLTRQQKYLNDAIIKYERYILSQTDIQTEDNEARDLFRFELDNYEYEYENNIYDMEQAYYEYEYENNIYDMEQAYNHLVETIDEENERLDEIVGDYS